MIFESPLWLLGLLALPVIALADAWIARRDRARTSRLVARALWRLLGGLAGYTDFLTAGCGRVLRGLESNAP